MEGGDGSGGASEDEGQEGVQAVWYLLVVRTKTRVMMRMKTSRNAASPPMMAISSVSLVGLTTSPGPWCRAGVRAQPQPPNPPQASGPPGAGTVSPCPLPSPTHNDSQPQLHQLGQDQWVRLDEPAKESRDVSSRAGAGVRWCPCVPPTPARTGLAG